MGQGGRQCRTEVIIMIMIYEEVNHLVHIGAHLQYTLTWLLCVGRKAGLTGACTSHPVLLLWLPLVAPHFDILVPHRMNEMNENE